MQKADEPERRPQQEGEETEETGKPLHCHLRVRVMKDDLVFGPGIAELMEQIERTESLSEACRHMGMAYSKGWKILKRAESELGYPLANGSRGGSRGGKMELTERGRQFLIQYRSFEADIRRYADEAFRKYDWP